jgi:hypothetical protein
MATLKTQLRRWVVIVGTAAALGAGTAYAQIREVACCYPCTCLPNGTTGYCCGPC